MPGIAPTEAAKLVASGKAVLVDIREPDEWELAAIEGAERRSMSTINEWWQDLPADREVVIDVAAAGVTYPDLLLTRGTGAYHAAKSACAAQASPPS